MNIAEAYDALSVKAAGDHSAVNEYAEVIGEAVAEYRAIALLAGDVGPFKAIAPFKVELMAYAISARALLPFGAQKLLFHKIEGTIVSSLVVASVPEAEDG